jgi:hypothetical protein
MNTAQSLIGVGGAGDVIETTCGLRARQFHQFEKFLHHTFFVSAGLHAFTIGLTLSPMLIPH